MGKAVYSVKLCAELIARVRNQNLHLPFRRRRYEAGDRLLLPLTLAWPERKAIGAFLIEKFAGGGFAGQVYRCVLENLDVDSELAPECGLRTGGIYAVKILVPPGRFAVWFRNWVYSIAFQAPFSAQVLESACRSGLLWPKVLRLAAGPVFGSPEAVADTYASFYDEEMGAYGEVREWVEGRTWRLESDLAPQKHRGWQTVNPLETESPEYVAKRQFMAKLVDMLHDMGADELARQYVWSTCKSQPNVLKRYGKDDHPSSGLCAVDFRAGLALVLFLPMSPGDLRLIAKGLLRGSLAQFDRFDSEKLRAYVAAHPEVFAGREAMVEALIRHDEAYRRQMPDVTHQGVRLLLDAGLRADVREGLVAGYRCAGLVEGLMAERLRRGGWRFAVFYLLGIVPFAGRFVRSLWGCPAYRLHWKSLLTQCDYLRRVGRAAAATAALEWHRAGRIGETHAQRIAAHPGLFWLERLTVGWMPAFLHRWTCEPLSLWRRLRASVVYVRRFLGDSFFREQWLRDQIEEGRREGMLGETEAGEMLKHVQDPFIAKYLKSVGVHLAFLPVTQVVSLAVGTVLALMKIVLLSPAASSAAWMVVKAVAQLLPSALFPSGATCQASSWVSIVCEVCDQAVPPAFSAYRR